MQNVRVQFTVPNVKNIINLDVHVNGEKRKLRFRVEKFDFDSGNGSSEDLITILRNRIINYDSTWEIYHIGTPADGKIPVTFRYKKSL